MNLNAIEKEKRMPYMTSVERLAREEGTTCTFSRGEAVGLDCEQFNEWIY